MSADKFWEVVMSWESEDSHRGRLVRAFKTNLGNSAVLQAQRVGLLSIHAERQANRKAGLSLV